MLTLKNQLPFGNHFPYFIDSSKRVPSYNVLLFRTDQDISYQFSHVSPEVSFLISICLDLNNVRYRISNFNRNNNSQRIVDKFNVNFYKNKTTIFTGSFAMNQRLFASFDEFNFKPVGSEGNQNVFNSEEQIKCKNSLEIVSQNTGQYIDSRQLKYQIKETEFISYRMETKADNHTISITDLINISCNIAERNLSFEGTKENNKEKGEALKINTQNEAIQAAEHDNSFNIKSSEIMHYTHPSIAVYLIGEDINTSTADQVEDKIVANNYCIDLLKEENEDSEVNDPAISYNNIEETSREISIVCVTEDNDDIHITNRIEEVEANDNNVSSTESDVLKHELPLTLNDDNSQGTGSSSEGTGLPPENINKQQFLTRMPGKVIYIYIKKGELVKYGQVLMVVEAMKLEMKIVAEFDSIITDIFAEEGSLSLCGQALFEYIDSSDSC